MAAGSAGSEGSAGGAGGGVNISDGVQPDADGDSEGTVDRGGEGNAGRDAEVVGEKDEAAVNEVEALGKGSSFTPRPSSVRLDRTHRAWLSRRRETYLDPA